jgi:hypothetical protein
LGDTVGNWLFLFATLLVSFPFSAKSADNLLTGKPPFVITYINYSDLQDYIALFQSIYEELGYEVSLLPVPAVRGLILLNDGQVDADLLRLKTTAMQFSNVLIVNPAMQAAELDLICIKTLPCDIEVLQDQTAEILVSENVLNLLDSENFKARVVTLSSVEKVPNMLRAKRSSYALYLVDELISRELQRDFQLVYVKDVSVHHVINKKYAALLPLIEQKLRDKLPALQASRKYK